MSKSPTIYDAAFYERVSAGSLASAKEIVPLVLEYIQPKSVVDVGCGAGAWLSTFQGAGVSSALGIDGAYVDTANLLFDPSLFQAADLTKPIEIAATFDLVVCLEVAEHLPGSSAAQLVESLTRLGPVVLFSAAVPFQGGTGHINEQWQDYWASLFAERDFMPVDCLRSRVWNNPRIGFEYAQNALFYASAAGLGRWPCLRDAGAGTPTLPLAAVHPRLYLRSVHPQHIQLRRAAASLVKTLRYRTNRRRRRG